MDVLSGRFSASSLSGVKIFRFMALPPELRLDIYDLCLVPGDIYVRWNPELARGDVRFQHMAHRVRVSDLTRWQTSSKLVMSGCPLRAQTQLLLVSKAIRDEALPHFLTRNVFHMMGCDTELPYLRWDITPPLDGHISRLSVSFDYHACSIEENVADLHSKRHKYLFDNPNSSDDDWRRHLHDELLWTLKHRHWLPLMCQISSLQLRYLEINVQHCRCPCACDDQVSWVLLQLFEWDITTGSPPEKIVIVGADKMQEPWIVKLASLRGVPHIHFEHTRDPWE